MYPASAAFKEAVRGSHVVISKAEIWNQDQKLLSLPIESGSVTINADAAVRRTAQARLLTTRDNSDLVPDSGFDALAPFGNELRLFRGIQFDDGTIEYVPLGVFVMTDVNITDENDGVAIELRGEDRSIIISRNKWTQPYVLTNGPLETAITNLLSNRYADVQTNFPTTNVTINQVILGLENTNDPWKDAVELCELVGYDLFFDVNGVATMKQFPSLEESVVVETYIEGEETSLLSVERAISTKNTYNGVIYTVEGSQVPTPIRVEAWDEDTTSPTYRFGVFGQAPTFVTTNLLTTAAEASRAALLLLNRYIGAQEMISWSALVDPTLDVNDVVYIKSNGAKVDRLVILDSLDVPLRPEDSLSASARVVRIVQANEIVGIGS